MSFTFNWPRFSDQFHYDAIQMLNTALNKGNKPPIIADKIQVIELEMGTQPPELEIRDIGDLTVDQFRGIFRLTYAGDAHLVLKTKVQANPLNHKQPDIHLMSGNRGMLAAKQPLVVPMLLRLSHFKLSSYVVLVVSKQKGITLVFKTDPLQNVDINSTFDSIAVIQNFIQREIEGQLRQMFREDLPGIIHRLSQQWVKAKVETPLFTERPPLPRPTFETMSSPDISMHKMSMTSVGLQPQLSRHQAPGVLGYRRARSTSGLSVASTSTSLPVPPSTPTPPHTATPNEPVSFPDLENFDPTYGLRPEGLPKKSGFKSFSKLFAPNKGLADLAEEPSEAGDDFTDDGTSFDVIDWDDSVPGFSPPPSLYNDQDSSTEYETIPAVGGGVITRPRIYHSQSVAQASSTGITSSRPVRSISQDSIHLRQAIPMMSHNSSSSYGSEPPPRVTSVGPGSTTGTSFRSTPLYTTLPGRPMSPDSNETQASYSGSGTLPTPPTKTSNVEEDSSIYMRQTLHQRRFSVSTSNIDTSFSPSSPSGHHSIEVDPKIVLRPSINNSIHQLSTLSHSNHTLSPYTRSLSHFTVRSVPPRGIGPTGFSPSFERQPVKAKRKRIYKLGGQTARSEPLHNPELIDLQQHATSHPPPPSEFDASDMDRYFRS